MAAQDRVRRQDMRRGGAGHWRRDLAVAGLLGLAAAAAVFHSQAVPVSAAANPAGKLIDRLSFAASEDIPVRDTRIFDTVAMFSLASAEPSEWSATPVQALPVQALPVQPLPVQASAAQALPASVAPAPAIGSQRALPRMVEAAERKNRVAVKPPVRPVGLVAVAMPVAAAAAPGPDPSPARKPIRLAGFDLPGTEYLPGKQDAERAATYLGGRASALGSGTATAVTSGASAVGEAVSSATDSVAGAIGWR